MFEFFIKVPEVAFLCLEGKLLGEQGQACFNQKHQKGLKLIGKHHLLSMDVHCVADFSERNLSEKDFLLLLFVWLGEAQCVIPLQSDFFLS